MVGRYIQSVFYLGCYVEFKSLIEKLFNQNKLADNDVYT